MTRQILSDSASLAAVRNSNINGELNVCVLFFVDIREVNTQTRRSIKCHLFSLSVAANLCIITCNGQVQSLRTTRNTHDTVTGGPRRRAVPLNIQV